MNVNETMENTSKGRLLNTELLWGKIMHRITIMMQTVIFLACALACGAVLAAESRHIVVAQDGTGQFKTITEALESVKDAAKERPVDINIKPGTYVETITTLDWVNLIGENRDTCVIRYDGGPDAANTVKKHTVWATSNTTLQNLTIVGIRVKYCIHSDGGRAYVLIVENCTLRREYPDGEPKTFPVAFGIGLHADQHIVMKDCLLEAELPIYMHNWFDQRSSCSMTLEKCLLQGKICSLEICCLGSKQRDFFVIHDCVLEGLESGVKYVNSGPSLNPKWNGISEIELLGSGNGSVKITGAEIKDDYQKRQPGIELSGQAKSVKKNNASVRLEEKYGMAPGRLQKSQAWTPVKSPGDYGLSAEYSDDCLILTCPPEQENPKPFGYAGGPSGLLIEMPMIMEIRMKCVFGSNGKLELLYCLAPDSWVVEFQSDGIVDTNNKEAKLSINTAEWQTYRLVARTPDDVKLFVDGVPQDIVLKKSEHKANYFQFRVHGRGNKAMIERFLLTGALPVEQNK